MCCHVFFFFFSPPSRAKWMASRPKLDFIAPELNDWAAREQRGLRAVSSGAAGSHRSHIPAQITFGSNKGHVDVPGCVFTAVSCAWWWDHRSADRQSLGAACSFKSHTALQQRNRDLSNIPQSRNFSPSGITCCWKTPCSC